MATFYSNWSFTNSSSPNGASYVVDGKNVTYYNDVRYKFVVTESVNKSANTSTMTVKKYAVYYYTWQDSGGSISITMRSKIPNTSGTSYQSDTKSVSATTNSSSYTLVGTDTFTISHNADGSGSTSFYGLGTYVGGSGKTYTRTVSKSISLTKIDRPSTVTSNATSTTKFGDSITFSITRKSSKFTHTLKYKMYDSSGTIVSKTSSTSYNWTIPTSLVASTPNNVQPTITISCETFEGNTSQGTTTYSFKCLVPDSYVPTMNLTLAEANPTMISLNLGIYLQNMSQLSGSITTTESEGSPITAYLTNTNDAAYTTREFTTNPLKYNGERTITSKVTDARGRTAAQDITVNIIEYYAPTISSCKVERCLVDGTLSQDGTYGKATITYKVAPVNNGSSDLNTVTVKVTYGTSTKTATLNSFEGTYTFTELFYGLETNATYNFSFEVVDLFNSQAPQVQPYSMPPSFVTISKLAGGKGVTFGQVASEEGLVSHMNTKLYANNWANNMSINGLKTEKYADGSWITYAED